MRCQAEAGDCVLQAWYFETPPYQSTRTMVRQCPARARGRVQQRASAGRTRSVGRWKRDTNTSNACFLFVRLLGRRRIAALAGDVGGGDDGGMLMMEFSEARSSSADVCVGSQRRNALLAGSIDRPFVVVRPLGCAHTTLCCRLIEKGECRRGAGQGLEVDAVISEGEID